MEEAGHAKLHDYDVSKREYVNDIWTLLYYCLLQIIYNTLVIACVVEMRRLCHIHSGLILLW